jgi:hypothetical protein
MTLTCGVKTMTGTVPVARIVAIDESSIVAICARDALGKQRGESLLPVPTEGAEWI